MIVKYKSLEIKQKLKAETLTQRNRGGKIKIYRKEERESKREFTFVIKKV